MLGEIWDHCILNISMLEARHMLEHLGSFCEEVIAHDIFADNFNAQNRELENISETQS
jgi:hypothetical protein